MPVRSAAILRRLAAVLAAFALVAESGGHWVLLQSIAWVGMLASYARDRSLAEAVSDTFDGQHPCELCHAVADGQKNERRPDPAQPAGAKLTKKLTARVSESSVEIPVRGDGFFLLPQPPREKATERTETPPTPPPRLG